MNPAEFQADTPYAGFGTIAIDAPADARLSFIRKTYAHLAAAVYAFVAVSYLLYTVGFGESMLRFIGQSQMSWLFILIGFMVVSWIADKWARSSTSLGMQYAGLFLYVLAESVIFAPLFYFAAGETTTIGSVGTVGIIPAAAITTLVIFAGLTAVTFFTKKDFSFLGGFLSLAMFAAFALIFVGYFAGFSLGIWFSWLMVVVASGYILYFTSNVMHHYRTDQYVAASLALFASVALLLWYVILIFLSNRD